MSDPTKPAVPPTPITAQGAKDILASSGFYTAQELATAHYQQLCEAAGVEAIAARAPSPYKPAGKTVVYGVLADEFWTGCTTCGQEVLDVIAISDNPGDYERNEVHICFRCLRNLAAMVTTTGSTVPNRLWEPEPEPAAPPAPVELPVTDNTPCGADIWHCGCGASGSAEGRAPGDILHRHGTAVISVAYPGDEGGTP